MKNIGISVLLNLKSPLFKIVEGYPRSASDLAVALWVCRALCIMHVTSCSVIMQRENEITPIGPEKGHFGPPKSKHETKFTVFFNCRLSAQSPCLSVCYFSFFLSIAAPPPHYRIERENPMQHPQLNHIPKLHYLSSLL